MSSPAKPIECQSCRVVFRRQSGNHTGCCSEECRFFAKLPSGSQSDPEACWEWAGSIDAKGYGRFAAEGRVVEKAHRAAWRIFVGPIPDGAHLCHHCDNRVCVNPGHLFLGSNNDNVADKVSKDRHAHGETHGQAVLTEAIVLEARASTETDAEIARRFGISKRTIAQARSGTTWGHLPGAKPEGRRPFGEGQQNAVLTDALVLEIRASTETSEQLSQRYGIKLPTLKAARAGRSWTHLPGAKKRDRWGRTVREVPPRGTSTQTQPEPPCDS